MITRYGAYALATSPRPSVVRPAASAGAPADPDPEAPPAPTPTRLAALAGSSAPRTDTGSVVISSAVSCSAGDHTRVSSTTAAAETSDAAMPASRTEV